MNRFTRVLIACLSLFSAFQVYVIISACIGEPKTPTIADLFSLTSDTPISLGDSIFYAKEKIIFILVVAVLLFLKIVKKKNTNFISFVLITCCLIVQIWDHLALYLFIYPEILDQDGTEKLLSLRSILLLSIFISVIVLTFSFIKDLREDEKIYFITAEKKELRVPAFWVLAQLIPILILNFNASHFLFSLLEIIIYFAFILITFSMIYVGKTAFLFGAAIVLIFVSFQNIFEVYSMCRNGSGFTISYIITGTGLFYALNLIFHVVSAVVLYRAAKKQVNNLNLREI